ncbi:hypothetical protein JB92DRAFT_2796649, partial [Gautieria morchelliformis]
MRDSIFKGMACFSPSVLPEIKSLWTHNGGTIALSVQEQMHSNFYFCNGISDPWLPE